MKLGYEIVPVWRMERISFAQHLARFFEHLEIECVLDVGGNKGQYRDFMRMEVGYAQTGSAIGQSRIAS